MFVVGFSGGWHQAKDTLVNLRDTQECCVNIISEHFVEAANSTSIDAPYGTSEWAIAGLHPAPCSIIKASRVKEVCDLTFIYVVTSIITSPPSIAHLTHERPSSL
jgi:flavin reductase (DIM6/NTAB) family NADH-FMN oxidoreductase RutF